MAKYGRFDDYESFDRYEFDCNPDDYERPPERRFERGRDAWRRPREDELEMDYRDRRLGPHPSRFFDEGPNMEREMFDRRRPYSRDMEPDGREDPDFGRFNRNNSRRSENLPFRDRNSPNFREKGFGFGPNSGGRFPDDWQMKSDRRDRYREDISDSKSRFKFGRRYIGDGGGYARSISDLDFDSESETSSIRGSKKRKKPGQPQQGVRYNERGEKVVDVEISLTSMSRWGQLRKAFGKRDTAVALHLLEVHDECCEECYEREEKKKLEKEEKKKENLEVLKRNLPAGLTLDDFLDKPKEEPMTEEERNMQELMGFSNFNTTRGALQKEKKKVKLNEDVTEKNETEVVVVSESEEGLTVKETEVVVLSESEDTKDATNEEIQGESVETLQENVEDQDSAMLEDEEGAEGENVTTLSEEEKALMARLGWSVFSSSAPKAKQAEITEEVLENDDSPQLESPAEQAEEPAEQEEEPVEQEEESAEQEEYLAEQEADIAEQEEQSAEQEEQSAEQEEPAE